MIDFFIFVVHDKATVRFYYNLGIEFFKNLQTTYGMNQLIQMFDTETSLSDGYGVYEQERVESVSSQMTAEFQHMSIDPKESESKTPNKASLFFPFVLPILFLIIFLTGAKQEYWRWLLQWTTA